ncbi:glycoside hydrolase family 75 protein [Oidiodendron maius Zn]|uniref:Endo-chitosanase n=1 Tax=Oidiodendron maius (strain Zn) TaxID=913774 RepID=A0A0C3H5Q9_OIDMZ|nr:glycoside hydrolase family 75 protein [Oidiodendron maius Zn]
MSPNQLSVSLVTLTTLLGFACAAVPRAAIPTSVNGASYNKASAGPSTTWFAGATSLPAAKIASAAAKATKVPSDATYILEAGGTAKATIHSDWSGLSKGAAYVFVADMDVDCDGIDYKCKGNEDGQDQTNWGALSAYEVPWVVVPDKFASKYSSALPGNNVAAVICDGKIFYGVFADTDGDTPEEIGEASWLMARTCFPSEDLNGGNGHTPADVTYIVFTGNDAVLPSSAIGNNYLTNFNKLTSMGNQLLTDLVDELGL